MIAQVQENGRMSMGLSGSFYIHCGVNVSSSRFWEPGAWQQIVYSGELDEVGWPEIGPHTE